MTHKMGDGHEVEFDLDKFSIQEYRSLFSGNISEELEMDILSRASGLEPKEIASLSYIEWRKFIRAFIKACGEPLADPN